MFLCVYCICCKNINKVWLLDFCDFSSNISHLNSRKWYFLRNISNFIKQMQNVCMHRVKNNIEGIVIFEMLFRQMVINRAERMEKDAKFFDQAELKVSQTTTGVSFFSGF